jgi:hypothetical protein
MWLACQFIATLYFQDLEFIFYMKLIVLFFFVAPISGVFLQTVFWICYQGWLYDIETWIYHGALRIYTCTRILSPWQGILVIRVTMSCYFLQAHLAPGSETRFNFQKYISRSLDEDFKVVVGIRCVLAIIWALNYPCLFQNNNLTLCMQSDNMVHCSVVPVD